MKAIVKETYGPLERLQLKEVEKPAPDEGQLLIKILAASINTADLADTGGMARIWGGLSKPKDPRMGRDIAGRVEDVGRNVTQFKPGDEVFGACMGGLAEYAVARERNLALKPANCTFEEAAAIPVAGITALQGLRDKGNVQPGQKVVIDGASGAVGTFAVQIARAFGATVTAVCSTRNLDQARSLGAEQVIDYTREDFTRSGQQYDLILGVNGYHPIFDYRRALKPDGKFILVGTNKAHLFPAFLQIFTLGSLISRTSSQKMGFMGIAAINQKDLIVLKELVEAGKMKPVIDQCYPLSATVDAFKYLSEGHARAKIVITVQQAEGVQIKAEG